jgi:hypothetical protein
MDKCSYPIHPPWHSEAHLLNTLPSYLVAFVRHQALISAKRGNHERIACRREGVLVGLLGSTGILLVHITQCMSMGGRCLSGIARSDFGSRAL